MSSNPPSSRLSEVLRTVPPVTQGVIAVCVGIYLLQCLLDVNPTDWALRPAAVIRSNEYYRILTSPLLHLSPMHIGMNMMSTYAIGTMLEKRLGSFRMLFIVLSSMVVTGSVHVFGAWLVSLTLGKNWLMRESSVGFSGVLFHLSVLECNLGTHENRSVFGFFEVRASLYPWVLYVVILFCKNQTAKQRFLTLLL
jgi:membrane associated rhomboid family serine protease